MNTKAIAIAAVLALALTSFVVCLPAEQTDAAEEKASSVEYTTAGDGVVPVAYAEADILEKAEGTRPAAGGVIRTILYVDQKNSDKNLLMIDLNDVPVTKQIQNLYKVTLTPEGSTAPAVLENMAAVNGQIWLDVSGNDNTETPIKLMTAGTLTIQVTSQDIYQDSNDSDKYKGSWVPSNDEGASVVTIGMTIGTADEIKTPMTITLYDGSQGQKATSAFALPTEVHKLDQAVAAGTSFANLDQLATTNMPKIQNRFSEMTLDSGQDARVDGSTTYNNLIDNNGVYELIGWTVDSNKRDKVDLDLTAHTVEEIIYAYADGVGLESKDTNNANVAAVSGQVASKIGSNDTTALGTVTGITFVGVYEQNPYQIRLYEMDSSNANKDTYVEAEKTAAGIAVQAAGTQASAATSGTKAASATVNVEVDAEGYALLRIQQDSAATTSYTYALYQSTVKSVDKDGKITYNDPVLLTPGENPRDNVTGTDKDNTNRCTITVLANGIYKISDVNESLNIKVLMVAVDPAKSDTVTSYNLDVDYVKNYSAANTGKGISGPQGVASVSLDLYDTTVGENGKLRIDGTYYRLDSDNIRVYGQVSTIFSNVTPTAYVDNQQDNRFINQTTRATAVDGAVTGYTGSMDLYYKVVSGSVCDDRMEMVDDVITGSSYDLVVKLPTKSDVTAQYFFYAAQGVYAADGDFSKAVETPWALAETA